MTSSPATGTLPPDQLVAKLQLPLNAAQATVAICALPLPANPRSGPRSLHSAPTAIAGRDAVLVRTTNGVRRKLRRGCPLNAHPAGLTQNSPAPSSAPAIPAIGRFAGKRCAERNDDVLRCGPAMPIPLYDRDRDCVVLIEAVSPTGVARRQLALAARAGHRYDRVGESHINPTKWAVWIRTNPITSVRRRWIKCAAAAGLSVSSSRPSSA